MLLQNSLFKILADNMNIQLLCCLDAGPSDSGFLRYMLSTAGPLAFIGGCQRAHIDLGTRTLAGTDESVGPAVDNV